MLITFEAKNAAQMNKTILGIAKSAEEVTEEWLHKIADQIVYDIKSEMQNNMHVTTGELLGSVQVFEYAPDYVIVGSDSDHAYYFEFGRGKVRPVHKKMLRWIDKETGEEVFAKEAKEFPGTHLMTTVVNKHASEFKLLIEMQKRIQVEIDKSGVVVRS
jgi:methionine synthase II (cobalamin-independent)